MLGLLLLGSLFAFASLIAVGANDVANAIGTTVGSKALSVRHAVILAGVFEFAGSSMVGSSVGSTLTHSIISPEEFEPPVFVAGMFSALVGSFLWVSFATYASLPVSSTHAVVGSIVAVALVDGHAARVNWGTIGKISASWVLSPILGAALAACLYVVIKRLVLDHPRMGRSTRVVLSFLWALTISSTAVFVLVGGPPALRIELHAGSAAMVFFGAFAAVFFVALFVIVPLVSRHVFSTSPYGHGRRAADGAADEEPSDAVPLTPRAPSDGSQEGRGAEEEGGVSSSSFPEETRGPRNSDASEDAMVGLSTAQRQAERMFIPLMVASAAAVAFAHGGNDISNAVAPYGVIVQYHRTRTTAAFAVPLWISVAGGAAIVLGLALFGARVMETVGSNITKLTYTKGYAAQFGASVAVLFATVIGLPISTTSVLVGAIGGVGLAGCENAVDARQLARIAAGWIITLPAAGLLAAVCFVITRAAVA